MGDQECLIFDIGGSGVHVSAPLRLRLHGMVEPDGTATVHGIVILRGEGRVPLVLAAMDTEGTAAIVDADGDGLGGVARLTVSPRVARTGEVVQVRITPAGGQDLDEPRRSGSPDRRMGAASSFDSGSHLPVALLAVLYGLAPKGVQADVLLRLP